RLAHSVEQVPHRALELTPRSRVEAPAHGRRAHGVQRLLEALADRATEGDLPVIDADVERTLGVRADPGLVGDRRPVAGIVRQRNDEIVLTISAGGPFPDVVHAAPPFT